MKKILILDDEPSIRDFIVFNFKKAGYDVCEAASGREALAVFDANPDISLAVLDVMLPDIDGFEVCRKLREKNRAMGIVMLSAKDLDEDILSGFMSGADDYIKKPISPKILLAKIDALSRRVQPEAAPVATPKPEDSAEKIGNTPFSLDRKKHLIFKNGQALNLTPVEYNLMVFFFEHPNVRLRRDEILQGVWGYDFNGDGDIVNVNIRRLRLKIEDDPSNAKYIQTEWSYGYRWNNGDIS